MRPFKKLKPSMFFSHLSLFWCKPSNPSIMEKHVKQDGEECNRFELFAIELGCINLFYTIDSPDHTFEVESDSALPIGTNDVKYFLLNVQMDVEDEGLLGFNVEVGLKFTHTKEYRKNELQTLLIGAHPSIHGTLIPKLRKSFTSVAHCSPQCFGSVSRITLLIFNTLLIVLSK